MARKLESFGTQAEATSYRSRNALSLRGAQLVSWVALLLAVGNLPVQAQTYNKCNGSLSCQTAANWTGGVPVSAIIVNNSGTLLFTGSSSSTDRISNNVGVRIEGGGALDTGGLSEATRPSAATGGTNGVVGIGALTLIGNSDFHSSTVFGDGGSSLVLASPGANSSGAYQDISDWTGVAGLDDGGTGSDRLLFSSNQNLTNGDLANTAFDGFAPGSMMIAYGTESEMASLSPVPEPATWAAGMLTACAIGYTQRRRLTGLRRRAA